MTLPDAQPPSHPEQQIGSLFESAELTQAIESEQFRLFLDHVPIAIAVANLAPAGERLVYANKAYEALTGQAWSETSGKQWSVLDAFVLEDEPQVTFSHALANCDDFIGTFKREQPSFVLVEAYSGSIENENAARSYRIVALIDVTERAKAQREEFARRLRDKDMLLRELQHRVKNNLQLITALIRLDARNQRSGDTVSLDRLAGRIEALQILYQNLAAEGPGDTLDLGYYVSQIATAIMRTYGGDGIRLDLKVDPTPASINIAMPIGLLVNELMTNAFKYAFSGRESGTITVRCLQEANDRCRIVVADDGVGLPEGASWPGHGKLGGLILQSLRENAHTAFAVESAPGNGVRVSIGVTHKAAASRAN